MRLLPLSIAISIVLALSCSKKGEEPCDNPGWPSGTTFEPKAYLPLYPGSSWTYLDPSGNSVIKSVSDTYLPHQWSTNACSTPTALVPFWDDRFWYGYAHAIMVDRYPYRALLDAVREEPVGTQWTFESPGTLIQRTIVATDTSVDVLGTSYAPVIIVGEGYGSSFLSWSYYAKDIGLVLQKQHIGMDTLLMLQLQSHTILH